ncbi:MAG: phosphate/phosphite/phosphonate ABC transporter substrate-binding protein [Rhodospirillaceae bacterium]|jgi:phosphonate transport system substrate-binding protein|nr:phosphate/phosphite/phosphonate ABC transporter substrate-binding protein [Rhodospirillaceae bacterium]MBT7486625.1 phosphate/phosphite/phosphonate ABC transporter substrate-binding protein [Rhodospirillales bacterium]MBT3911164.1 phosphate/phosphite/phosphonate ABC transporter substrate-binding protein [Rhodospirillaceae bacterium]MBT5514583.1 phosphate/phosphite/phosphonate ABC transporter substrate-binding protein [Rhodospirillaceae bacterium]MBT6884574.1 phosphate/phosphite/phosphonate A
MPKKLFVKSSLTAVAAFALVAASSLSVKADEYIGGWQDKYPTINYGVISLETAVDIVKSQKAFAAYAGKELGVKFELFTASEYAGIMNALISGQVQVGWLGASSYAGTYIDCKCVEPIAGAQDPKGGMGYNSVLIVKAGSSYKSEADLKGKTVARNDPHSTSGFTIPTVAWAERGESIDRYFKSPLSGGHQQTIVGVLNGTYDGGFTWTTKGDRIGGLRKMMDKGLLKRDQIRVVWTSPLIPTPPVVIRKDLPVSMKADLVKLFLRLDERQPEMARAVAQGDTLGMQRVYHEDYVPVINAKIWLKKNRKKKKKGG